MPITVPNSDPVARAQQSAQVKYGGQEDSIKRAIASLAVTRAADQAAINQYGDSGRGAINATFDDLLSNLDVNRSRAAADLNTQANLVGQGYREANQVAEAARQQGAANLAGVAGSSNTFSADQLAAARSPLEALAARIIGDNAQNDATTTGNLRTWAAQHDALRGAGMDDARRDKSNRLSGFEGELLSSIAKSKNDATNQEYDFQSALLDLLNERGAYTADQANSLADLLFNQQLQAAQYNLSEQEAASMAAARNAASKAGNNDDYWKQKNYELALREADRLDLKAMGEPKKGFPGSKANSTNATTMAEKLAIAQMLSANPADAEILGALGVPGVGPNFSVGAKGSGVGSKSKSSSGGKDRPWSSPKSWIFGM